MAGDTVLTVVGNVTSQPELRFTQAGAAVCSFTVASTPRSFDKASGEWKDGEALFLRCTVWRQMAEQVAESLSKGTRVIVQGRLTQRSYTTNEGDKRTVIEMQVDEVGPSLRYATATVHRAAREGGTGTSTNDDPWGAGQQAAPQRQAPLGSNLDSEPPF